MEIYPNEQGNRITPLFVSFLEGGRSRLVGDAAKNQQTLKQNEFIVLEQLEAPKVPPSPRHAAHRSSSLKLEDSVTVHAQQQQQSLDGDQSINTLAK